MLRAFAIFLVSLRVLAAWAAEPNSGSAGSAAYAASGALVSVPSSPKKVVVIPAREQVDTPLLFIIRRGLKEAIADGADVVVLDMKTPGGALDVTFEIMEALGKFPGQTITFVNDQAISAGAFIAATTEEIWFAPRGKIGAAAPVGATGQEIDKTMQQKVVSYLRAEVRLISEGKGFRGQVISAMIDENFELKIADKVLKPKGELLTLTASEATVAYGDPSQPLLATGIAKDITDLLVQKYGVAGYTTKTLEITWSERFAVFLKTLAPILMGVGMLALYAEFKTPGFSVFGATGVSCLAAVFASNYVAGLSGHEPMLVFGLGFLLVLVEVIFFPGIVVAALAGMFMMLGSLVWSLADIWPNQPITLSDELFLRPVIDLGLGLVVAVVLALSFARFVPRDWFFSRLAVANSSGGAAELVDSAPEFVGELDAVVGRVGVAATGLFPSGQVEVEGRRFEARVAMGTVPAGERIVVRGRTDFGLLVELLVEGRK